MDVVFASGGIVSVRAAMAATQTIPIVFTTGVDPVSAGFVASLGRPGQNVTAVNKGADALLVSPEPFFNSRRDRIVALAARRAIPTIYSWRE